MWGEDARTDRAIELLQLCAAKTNKVGEVVPRHRYSRSLRAAAYAAMWNLDPYGHSAFSLRREQRGARWVMVCTIEGPDGYGWTQTGECGSDEAVYDSSALAICRALLHYTEDEDAEPMSEAAVIAMLEENRARALEHVARQREDAG